MENRFARIEKRVDEIKEDVALLKGESKFHTQMIKEFKDDLKQYTIEIKSHVAGDNKIINEISPLMSVLPSIKQMIEEKQYKEKRKKERLEKAKIISKKITFIATIIGTLAGITKILDYFFQ